MPPPPPSSLFPLKMKQEPIWERADMEISFVSIAGLQGASSTVGNVAAENLQSKGQVAADKASASLTEMSDGEFCVFGEMETHADGFQETRGLLRLLVGPVWMRARRLRTSRRALQTILGWHTRSERGSRRRSI